MDNFKGIEEIILSKEAGIKILDENNLENSLDALINSKEKREQLRLNCLDVFAGEFLVAAQIEIST